MKKIITLLLIAAMIFTISSCKDPHNENTISETPQSTTFLEKLQADTASGIKANKQALPTAQTIPTAQAITTAETNSTENGYIGNKHSKKFHRPDCYTLPKEKNQVHLSSREEALKQGYYPCANCNP